MTNEEQDYTEFEPEDGCFAAPRGKVPAAKKKKPAVRRIKGASGDLYDHDSDAHHLALKLLASRLLAIGFAVRKKPDRETTLRVYPRKMLQYPLLNPRFFPTLTVNDDVNEFEHLDIAVLSRGDGVNTCTMPCARKTLHQYLEKFNDSRDDGVFLPYGGIVDDYYLHGDFILGVEFKANTIDFKALDKPLRDLWQFLDDLPASKSR